MGFSGGVKSISWVKTIQENVPTSNATDSTVSALIAASTPGHPKRFLMGAIKEYLKYDSSRVC